MYTLTLNDGTKIEGLALRNNCLVSAQPITARMLAGKLNPVTISGVKDSNDDEDISGLVGTHAHMNVAYIKQNNGTYRLALADISDKDWDMAELKATVAYLAMSAGL